MFLAGYRDTRPHQALQYLEKCYEKDANFRQFQLSTGQWKRMTGIDLELSGDQKRSLIHSTFFIPQPVWSSSWRVSCWACTFHLWSPLQLSISSQGDTVMKSRSPSTMETSLFLLNKVAMSVDSGSQQTSQVESSSLSYDFLKLMKKNFELLTW